MLPVILALFLAASTSGCGEDCGTNDCVEVAYKCDKYPDPTSGIVIHCMETLPEGHMEWTTRIFINLEGIKKVEGYHFEGQEFLDRVQLASPGHDDNEFVPFNGKDCIIAQGGDRAGEEMEGQCNFSFVDGTFLTVKFDCLLESVE